MSAAWHSAKLTAYPPEKSKDFIKLDKLLHREKPASQAGSWRDKLAEARAWVGSFKRR